MRKIPLTRGKFALVDNADFQSISGFNWQACPHRRTWYARRAQKPQSLHQFIMGINGVDHVNGNGLDNRRSNLRPATNSQNAMNRRKPRGTLSKFKGVTWNRSANKWHAQIKLNGKLKYLGVFSIETDAAKAYDGAASDLFGSFARLNFP